MNSLICENVRVMVKFQSAQGDEVEMGAANILEKYHSQNEPSGKIVSGVISQNPDSRKVIFHEMDGVYEANSTSKDVFMDVGKTQIQEVVKGYDSCFISYGSNRTGKHRLFFGDNTKGEESAGFVVLCVENLFSEIEKLECFEYEVVLSFWEMNNEEILDLLQPSSRTFRVWRSDDGEKVIKNLSRINLNTFGDFVELFNHALSNSGEFTQRRNGISWHKFLKLTLIRNDATNPEKTVKNSLVFVNLRGSHRFGQIGLRGNSLKEGSKINKSLTSFANMIRNVVNYCATRFQQGPNEETQKEESEEEIIKKLPGELHSVFLDNKLTSLMADYFGGKYFTTFICGVSMSEFQYRDTINILETMKNARFIPVFPRITYLKNNESELYESIQQMEKKLPKDPLAPGHPPTEAQEELNKLKMTLSRIAQGEDPDDDDFIFEDEDVGDLDFSEDSEVRLWKKNRELSKKHGYRKTFFMPKKLKKKKFKEKWGRKELTKRKKKQAGQTFKYQYRGQWRKNRRHGYGFYESKNEKYEGSWKLNKKDGSMGILWVNVNKGKKLPRKWRRTYKGSWKSGKRHGEGVAYYQNGDIYYGGWKKDLRHGPGEMYTTDGSRFSGEYAEDKKCGFGVLEQANGDIFKGHFLNDKKHGPGVFLYKNKGQIYKGTPKCGEIHFVKDMEKRDEELTVFEGQLQMPELMLEDSRAVVESTIVETRAKTQKKYHKFKNQFLNYQMEFLFEEKENQNLMESLKPHLSTEDQGEGDVEEE